MSELEIHKMLAVSTGNVEESTWDWLNRYSNSLPNRVSECPITVYSKSEYGWFIPIVEREGKDEPEMCNNPLVPLDLRKVIKYAQDKNCTWIMFDRDADMLPGTGKEDSYQCVDPNCPDAKEMPYHNHLKEDDDDYGTCDECGDIDQNLVGGLCENCQEDEP